MSESVVFLTDLEVSEPAPPFSPRMRISLLYAEEPEHDRLVAPSLEADAGTLIVDAEEHVDSAEVYILDSAPEYFDEGDEGPTRILSEFSGERTLLSRADFDVHDAGKLARQFTFRVADLQSNPIGISDSIAGWALRRRPNLAELEPTEFEHFLAKLLCDVGYEVTVTSPTRDGGIDLLLRDLRPLRKGTVIVQAKRYRNPVGVSAIRELYGTLPSEGAGKGILITTSVFTSGALVFAAGKPLELIDGEALLGLCADVGIGAVINLPRLDD